MTTSTLDPSIAFAYSKRHLQPQVQALSDLQQRPNVLIPSNSPLVKELSNPVVWKGKGTPNTAEDREPWTLSLAPLERFIATRDLRRVIFLLGDPPAVALLPLLTSPALAGSLLLLGSLSPSASPPILHPMPPTHPTIRTLKPEPKYASQPEAVRVMYLLEKGEKVARAWRKQMHLEALGHQAQTRWSQSQAGRELDELSELSSPGTPPLDPSRPDSSISTSTSMSTAGGIFSFSRLGRQPSAQPSPMQTERAFDAIVLFLPSNWLAIAGASAGTSDFEMRANASHALMKLAILVSTLSAPFLVGKREQEAIRAGMSAGGVSAGGIDDRRRSGESSVSSLLRHDHDSPGEKRGMLGILRPKMRKLSASSSTCRRPPPLQLTRSVSNNSAISTAASGSALTNSLSYDFSASRPLNRLRLPAQLVHVLPAGLDMQTQATLARSLDGFLASFSFPLPASSAREAPDSPGGLALRTVHTCLLPLGALSDPLPLPVTSAIRLVQAEQKFSPLELLVAGCLLPPVGRTTRWLPSLHPPDTILSHNSNSALSPSPTLSLSPIPSASIRTPPTGSTDNEPSPLLSPSNPLARLTIPIRSHVLHSRAEEMGKHRSGHRDRRGWMGRDEDGVMPQPDESRGSWDGGKERGVGKKEEPEEVKTPSTGGSVATVRKRRWGRQY